MHCASAGELEQGKPVLEALKKEYPHFKILVSFFSPSGIEAAKKYSTADYKTYLPLDTKENAATFLSINTSTNPILSGVDNITVQSKMRVFAQEGQRVIVVTQDGMGVGPPRDSEDGPTNPADLVEQPAIAAHLCPARDAALTNHLVGRP